MGSDFFARQHGNPVNVAEESLRLRAAIEASGHATNQAAEPVIVTAYDSTARLVTVKFKDAPQKIPMTGIPVWGQGGDVRVYSSPKAGDVGIVLYVRSLNAPFDDKNQRTSGVTQAYAPAYWPVFLPGAPSRADTPPNLTLASTDTAIVVHPGTANEAVILVKADGSLQLNAPKIGLYAATPVARQAAIASPSGGGTIDTQARAAIDALRAALTALGATL